MRPNFSSYSYQQLLQSFRNVNRKIYPDRFEEILAELRKKKPNNIRIVKSNSGFRILEKDQIPRSVENFSPKTFSYLTGSEEFKSNFLIKYVATLVPLTLVVMIRIWTSDWSFKNELLWGLPFLVILSLVLSYFYPSSNNKEVKLTFFDDRVEESRKEKSVYYLSELRRIEVKEVEKDYVNMVTLYFENNRKLRISDFEPNYREIKKYLKDYLSARFNYESYLTNGSEL